MSLKSSQPRKAFFERMGSALVVGLWGVGVAVCFLWLANYDSKAGVQVAVPERWPASTVLRLASHGPTMVLCVTPACPCSRASVGELERILAAQEVRDFLRQFNGGRGRASVRVIFHEVEAAPAEGSELWNRVSRIAGVETTIDRDGSLCRSFGAETSGQAMVFDQDGALQFRGGITISRGHSGESEGGQAVRSILSGGKARVTHSPVFGCALP